MSLERKRPEVAKAIAELRANTQCAHCSKSPIEWHGEHHPDQPARRIANMVDLGYRLNDIMQEVARCTPLCRSCHMKEDGRTAALIARATECNRGRLRTEERPCPECGVPSRLRCKGVCYRCYKRTYKRAHRTRQAGD